MMESWAGRRDDRGGAAAPLLGIERAIGFDMGGTTAKTTSSRRRRRSGGYVIGDEFTGRDEPPS